MDQALNITFHGSDLVRLDPDEPGFMMVDGFTLVPRASIQINPDCPREITETIHLAMMRGWIKPCAALHREEYILDRMRNSG